MSFSSPFDELGPPPEAVDAARQLQAELEAGLLGPELTASLWRPGGGKMFGVLVAEAADGERHTLRSFSGVLGARWRLPGFVGPLFDEVKWSSLEARGLMTLRKLDARLTEARRGSQASAGAGQLAALRDQHLQQLQALDAELAERQAARADRRARGCAPEVLDALAQESRGDKRRRRWLVDEQARQLAPLARHEEVQRRRVAWLERLRAVASAALMRRLHDTYAVRDFAGSTRSLRSLYAPAEPPSGAGDCAAPKLLAQAQRLGLKPVALAEFWFGAPAADQARTSGAFSPACMRKCGPLLPFMLQGVSVAAPRRFVPQRVSADAVRVLFEDAWLVVVDKPEGLLSAPGKTHDESVLRWAQRTWRSGEDLRLVHRLDLDTSGVLVLAKDAATHRALQHQFLKRSVEKRYVAVLEGLVAEERGRVALAMRVDVDARPKQVVDPMHGKSAVTGWEVLARVEGRTRVALRPLTGRTHQLRVHCAHPLGLACPIVGDRLYGKPAERLLLHAERLAFDHPETGVRVVVESPVPF